MSFAHPPGLHLVPFATMKALRKRDQRVSASCCDRSDVDLGKGKLACECRCAGSMGACVLGAAAEAARPRGHLPQPQPCGPLPPPRGACGHKRTAAAVAFCAGVLTASGVKSRCSGFLLVGADADWLKATLGRLLAWRTQHCAVSTRCNADCQRRVCVRRSMGASRRWQTAATSSSQKAMAAPRRCSASMARL